MKANGIKGESVLGSRPDKDSKMYKDFHLAHFGQWVSETILVTREANNFHYYKITMI